MLKITLLGNSALLPLPNRALTAAFLEYNGFSVLFDCGEGTQTAAAKAGVSLMKTDVIAFTHYHGDHIFGLPGLLQTMHMMQRTKPLLLTGPKGLQRNIGTLLSLCMGLQFEIILYEHQNEPLPLFELLRFTDENFMITPFVTDHKVPSCGYTVTLKRMGKFLPEKAQQLKIPKNMWSILQKGQTVTVNDKTFLPEEVLLPPRKGLKLVLSGDTSPCETLINAAKNADLLISEATYALTKEADMALEHGHMTFAMAAETAQKAEVAQLILTHFSQRIKTPEEYLPLCTEVFGNTLCGYDGLCVDLCFCEE